MAARVVEGVDLAVVSPMTTRESVSTSNTK